MSKNAWQKKAKEARDTPKFLRAGTHVIVDISVIPEEEIVEGKFGKRPMIVIGTREYGLIYVSKLQFLHICEVLQKAEWENVTVEL